MYQALYRKYRPKTFDDVVGQEHITETLKKQVETGRLSHAYLFIGTRGTGKTTCAKILAKAVNCEHPVNGNPCNQCAACRGIDDGSILDVVELDAASNNGVDNVRALRDEAVFSPANVRKRVYIIDEVHMLSTSAFNALLKTMEEPPPHVKFILATTEIHKVPATIVSRCQHFDFHRIRNEDIVSRLMYIASQEGFTLHEDAAGMIARLSDGGMRDALSLLDQCVAYENDITLDVVSSASGIAGRDYLFDILEKIAEKDAAGALRVVDKLYDMSKDLKVLAGELLAQMRNVMIIKTIDNNKDLITCLPDEYERLKALAERMKLDEILGDINTLQECSERFAKSTSKRIELEMCIIKLCGAAQKAGATVQAVSGNAEITVLLNRITQLENALKNGAVLQTQPQIATPAQQEQAPPPKPFDPDFKKMKASDFKLVQTWDNIVEQVKQTNPAIGCFLVNSKAYMCQNVLLMIVHNDFYLKKFKASGDATVLNEILKNNFGQNFTIKVKSAKNVAPEDTENPINQLLDKAKKLDIEVDIKK